MGVVEDVANDPEKAGRIKVRVYGLHSVDHNILPTDDLPWAQILLPPTDSNFTGLGRSATGIVVGAQVCGFFADPDSKQQPIVTGTIGGLTQRSRAQKEILSKELNPRIPGNSNPEKAFRFFLENGYDENQAAGIAGVLVAKNGATLTPTSEGLGSWTGERRSEFLRFASLKASSGHNIEPPNESLETQLSFILHELETKYVSTNSEIVKAKTANDAAEIFQAAYIPSSPLSQSKTSASEIKASYGSSDGDRGDFTPPKVTSLSVAKGNFLETKEEILAYLTSSQRPIAELVVHHTDTYENQNWNVDDIENWHVSRGFSEIGYHFLILREGGKLQVARNVSKQGAHAKEGGHNENSIGISFVGGIIGHSSKKGKVRSSSTFTSPQWKTFDLFVEAFLQVYPKCNVVGHNVTDPSHRTDPEFDVATYVRERFAHENEDETPTPALSAPQELADEDLDTTDEDVFQEPASDEEVDLVTAEESQQITVIEGVEQAQIPSGAVVDLSEYIKSAAVTLLLSSYLQNINAETLNDLSDVVISSPANGEILKYNSSISKWVNGTGSGGASVLDDLTDVVISSGPTSGDVLQHDGVNWIDAPLDYSDLINTPTIPSTTTQISEGTNLYFTDERVDDRVAVLVQNGGGITWTYDDGLNTLTPAVDHGGLGGLGDDDHTQYLLANGSRALSADWDAGSFVITSDQMIAGDPGVESTGITIRGAVFDSSLKVSNIGGAQTADFILHKHSSDFNSGVNLIGAKTASATSSHSAVSSTETLMTIYGAGHDGTDYELSSQIDFMADGTIASNDIPGKIVFSTASGGTMTEHLRINKSGAFGLSGANFGTTDYVLSSNGSSSAPTWKSVASLETYSSAAELLTAILTVDGAGSGLDADLLDGNSSAYYRDADNINAGTLDRLYGGHGGSTFSTALSGIGLKAFSLTSIADDAADNLELNEGATVNGCIIIIVSNVAAGGIGVVYCRAAASASETQIIAQFGSTINVVAGTGALTGTTGTDTKLNIRGDTTGLLYLENRTGSSRSYSAYIFPNI